MPGMAPDTLHFRQRHEENDGVEVPATSLYGILAISLLVALTAVVFLTRRHRAAAGRSVV